ncbi:MAG: PAS domain S-box protein, partial [Candidatus Zixiibacteriota bacterium]
MDDDKKSRQQLLDEIKKLRQQIASNGAANGNFSDSREQYRLLVKNVRSDLAVFDYNGKILYVNEISATQFGLKPDQLIGRKISEFFPPELSERQLTNI